MKCCDRINTRKCSSHYFIVYIVNWITISLSKFVTLIRSRAVALNAWLNAFSYLRLSPCRVFVSIFCMPVKLPLELQKKKFPKIFEAHIQCNTVFWHNTAAPNKRAGYYNPLMWIASTINCVIPYRFFTFACGQLSIALSFFSVPLKYSTFSMDL